MSVPSWRIPRFPSQPPRRSMATMSPSGVTRLRIGARVLCAPEGVLISGKHVTRRSELGMGRSGAPSPPAVYVFSASRAFLWIGHALELHYRNETRLLQRPDHLCTLDEPGVEV